jgi:hypothetical protein
LTIFDVDFMFTKIRSKSVGETATLSWLSKAINRFFCSLTKKGLYVTFWPEDGTFISYVGTSFNLGNAIL